jgi:hypothetical protein
VADGRSIRSAGPRGLLLVPVTAEFDSHTAGTVVKDPSAVFAAPSSCSSIRGTHWFAEQLPRESALEDLSGKVRSRFAAECAPSRDPEGRQCFDRRGNVLMAVLASETAPLCWHSCSIHPESREAGSPMLRKALIIVCTYSSFTFRRLVPTVNGAGGGVRSHNSLARTAVLKTAVYSSSTTPAHHAQRTDIA